MGQHRLDLEEFLELIIHGNGHGEFVSQKTREAIAQVMNPDAHLNTVDINDFKFILEFQAKRNNILLAKTTKKGEIQKQGTTTFNMRATNKTTKVDKEASYGTAYIMILKALDLKPIHKSHESGQVDSYVKLQLNNDYVGNTSTIWQTLQQSTTTSFHSLSKVWKWQTL